MLTPASIESVRAVPSRRQARLLVDHGGLFISVDGDGPLQRELVRAVLETAMSLAAPGATRMGPAIAPFRPLPLCHGSVLGSLQGGAHATLAQLIARAGYTLG